MSVDSSPADTTTVSAGTTDTATDAGTTSDVKQVTSGSSAGDEGDKGPKSMIDAVKAALAPKTGSEGSPPSQTQDQTNAGPNDPAKKDADELPEEVTEEELKDQKPKTRKRIEQLLGKVKTLGSQVGDLSPKAQQFDQLTGFIERNNLSREDVNVGFEVMGLMKADPVKALEKLTPIVQQLQQLVGDVLPAELQERVRLGYISEADARSLNRSQRGEALAREQVRQTEQRTTEQRETERVQGVVRDVSSTISEWEKGKSSSDPDWHLKQGRIDQLVRLEVYEKGYPKTAKDAVTMVGRIYDEVTKEVRRLVPKPSAVTAATGTTSTQTAAAPKTMLEAIQAGLRKTA